MIALNLKIHGYPHCFSGLFFLLLISLLPALAQGAPSWGDEFTLDQPDGAEVQVRIWGDEFYRVVESLDGFTLVRDSDTGEICYAELSGDGRELCVGRSV